MRPTRTFGVAATALFVSLGCVLVPPDDTGGGGSGGPPGGLGGVVPGDSGTKSDGGTGDAGVTGHRKVFVTANRYTGDLAAATNADGGLTGADRVCTNAAIAGGLPGTFRAWISTDAVDAIDRVTSDGPWYQPQNDGGELLTFELKTSWAGVPLVPIQFNEFGVLTATSGVYPAYGQVWTATNTGGRRAANGTCVNFTDSTNASFAGTGFKDVASSWTSFGMAVCSDSARLYCFQL